MPEYKLTYFPGKGRAEVSRMVLAYSGRKFTDERIQPPDWPTLKPLTPQGHLPVLQIDGGKTVLVQALSIARYLARETGLAGKDSLQQAQVDMILETMYDIQPYLPKIYFEKDPEKKEELVKAFKTECLPPIFTFMEKTISDNSTNSGFYVGKALTVADFMVWTMVDYSLGIDPNCLDGYPKMKANRDKISELPKFAEYIKNRPQTPY